MTKNLLTLDTPIVLMIYNRPNLTKEVLSTISKVRPTKIYIIADGPKDDKDKVFCETTRDLVNQIDWDCSVEKNYSATNLGLKHRISSGLDWVFQKSDKAIILEDDCVPHSTFFTYCDELLKRYYDDERVFMISGDNFQKENSDEKYSYYFSIYPYIWGWATWARSWKHYDVNMSLWPTLRETSWLSEILHHEKYIKYWENIFDRVYKGEINTWDYQLVYSCWVRRSLALTPTTNLVKNIGFGPQGTFTKNPVPGVSDLPCEPMKLPLRHPTYIIRNNKADTFTGDKFFSNKEPSFINKIKDLIYQTVSRNIK